MKRKTVLSIITLAVIYTAALLFAQDDTQGDGSTPDVSIPPGMEARSIANGVTVLMPIGGKIHQQNATTFTLESAEEYSARKLEDVDRRLRKLEAENVKLMKEFEVLKKDITTVKETDGAEKISKAN